jgi:hypothetical protein
LLLLGRGVEKGVVCGDALAAVAVTGAAFAQATISGTMATAYDKVNSDAATTGMTTVDVRFSVSEDLGGGLRASGFVEMDLARARGTQALVADSGMSLAGGFGSLAFAKTRGGNTAMNARLYGADLSTAAVNTAGVMSNTGVRGEVHVLSYTSPEVMPGLRFNVGQAQLLTGVVADTNTNSQKRDRVAGGTTNIFGVTYTAGPLSIGFTNKTNSAVALTTADGVATAFITAADKAIVDAFANGSGAANTKEKKREAYDAGVLAALGGAAEKSVNELSIAYDLGVARVALGWGGKLTATGKALQVVGISAPLASNITVGLTSGERGAVKFQELGATYAFSKRTSLQFATGNFTPRGAVAAKIGSAAIDPASGGDDAAAIAGATYTSAAAKTTQTRIRLVHAF